MQNSSTPSQLKTTLTVQPFNEVDLDINSGLETYHAEEIARCWFQPLNFDSRDHAEEVRVFLSAEDCDPQLFSLLFPDSEDERVVVTELVKVEGRILGVLSLEFTEPQAKVSGVRVRYIPALGVENDELIDIIARQLQDLAERQNWGQIILEELPSVDAGQTLTNLSRSLDKRIEGRRANGEVAN